MSAGGLQAALAHMLVDDGARRGLHSDAAELGRRFGLTEEQLAALRRLDAQRLELTARLGRAKRLDFLQRGLPATLRCLELAGRHAMLHDFVRSTWASVDSGEGSRALSEGRRFAAYLDAQGLEERLGWIRDVAGLELVELELLADRAASESAWRAARAGAVPDDREVVLGRHVRVASFAYDALGLSRAVHQELPREVAPAPTHLLVVKRRERPLLAAHRIGEAVAAMLRSCSEPRRLDEVLAAAGAPRSSRAEEAVRLALAEGVLLVV